MAMVIGGLTTASTACRTLKSTTRFRVTARQGDQAGETSSRQSDYYSVLGVSPAATTEEIRKSYRKLQKQHHPDISGAKGHEMTLLLNEAYRTLTDHHLRAKYNAAFPHLAATSNRYANYSCAGATNMYSSWKGPDRPEGLFVDENACVGCRECWFAARNTFGFDESTGSARVSTQYGDSDELIKVAMQTCPVNCIHWVDRGDLRTLEYLMRPRQKPSNGIFGGVWETPSNIFMAAKLYKLQQQRVAEGVSQKAHEAPSPQAESPAQRKARVEADLKLRIGPLWSLFSWMSETSSRKPSPKSRKGTRRTPLGKSCTREIYSYEIPLKARTKTIQAVQEWAINFASSSEIPLPVPFKTDFLENGVALKLISSGDGVLISIGSFYITVELPEGGTSPGDEDHQLVTCFVCITTHGSTDTRSLPGEGRIIKLLEDMLLGRDSSYLNYRIPRKSVEPVS